MLSDEQIVATISPLYAERRVALIALAASRDEYRAIESAATAPLLARIAELEQQLAEARKDAERYRFLCNCRGQHTELCFDGESYRGKQEFDAAIDTAIKEQT